MAFFFAISQCDIMRTFSTPPPFLFKQARFSILERCDIEHARLPFLDVLFYLGIRRGGHDSFFFFASEKKRGVHASKKKKRTEKKPSIHSRVCPPPQKNSHAQGKRQNEVDMCHAHQ